MVQGCLKKALQTAEMQPLASSSILDWFAMLVIEREVLRSCDA